MSKYDYEKDDVIRHKKKLSKPKTKRSNHKHEYVEYFVDDGSISKTEKKCSICGVTKIVRYHFRNNMHR